MLTCIVCANKEISNDGDNVGGTPRTKQAVKSLTSQIKDMALKASGAYKNCNPCPRPSTNDPNHGNYTNFESGSVSSRFGFGYQRTGNSTPRVWGKEMEARLKALSSGASTPVSVSGRTDLVVFMEEDEGKEWVAQVEPGVLITFVSLNHGGNDLKRIRFSREIFNKYQAQRWWSENCEKIMELYNVQRFNQQGVPLPSPPRSEDESSITESIESCPVTPPLTKEHTPRNFYHPAGMGYSSSDSPDQQPNLASVPKLSNMNGTKTKTSSADADQSARTSSSREADQSGESAMKNEWIEQDEPGVYITIRTLPGGARELRRVRFSRERFGEVHARVWWEQNRARIQQQYL
ncbi:transcription factor brevis radix (BRX) domain-containing protein [Artemisia annua]|uniref:Transcription factor brevis radix (BRX) domain-containing protein n=1 Tax=Artemisia annua TaxID=35608 RepID=A0A2U1LAW9_ARTAN|nr:transcription factor brevis radix (BRX) domain-containing protein [Artemisia annua]